jgi:hypothetical protein
MCHHSWYIVGMHGNDNERPPLIMERIGKLSESDRSFDIEFRQRLMFFYLPIFKGINCYLCSGLGYGGGILLDLRKKVTPNSHFKELLSGLNTAGAKYLQK